MNKLKYVFMGMLVLCVSVSFAYFQGNNLTIGDKNKIGSAPYFYGTFDAAGYTDWIYYGYSPEHPHGYHEILSGEIGCAIFIPGTEKLTATWLTQLFEFPNWPTDSDFVYGGVCQAWHDPNGNPTPLYNRGTSVVYNDLVEVTVDYEVVDLEFRDPNIYGSPRILMIRDHNGIGFFANCLRFRKR